MIVVNDVNVIFVESVSAIDVNTVITGHLIVVITA
jgi:hypothetical protein